MAEEELNEKRDDNSGSATPVIAVLGVVFLLGVALGGLYYLMLRVWRQRPSVIYSTMAGVTLLTFAGAMLMDPVGSFTGAISSPGDLGENWPKLMPLYAMVSMVIADILGFALVNNSVKAMERSPHLLSTKGSWMYQFKYRRTPKEKRQHKQIVERLRNGSYGDETRSPLGIDESDDRPYMPAFRYASEARRHTFIIGGSGSGKPLHRNTEVPTPNGFVTIDKLKEDDIVFDENGKETTVLSSHHPVVKKSFKMTLKNGQEIVSGDEHLWLVHDLSIRGDQDAAKEIGGEDIISRLEELVKTTAADEWIRLSSVKKEFPTLARFTRDEGFPRQKEIMLSVDRITGTMSRNRRGTYSAEVIDKWKVYSSSLTSKTISVSELRSIMNGVDTESLERHARIDSSFGYNALEVYSFLRDKCIDYRNKNISTKTISSQEIYDLIHMGHRLYFPHVAEGVEYQEETPLPIDPYTLGAWIGDGQSNSFSLCGGDKEIIDRIGAVYDYSEKPRKGHVNFWDWNIVEIRIPDMKQLGIYNNKHIPDVYKRASIEHRKELIAGLIDTDGTIAKNGAITLTMTNRKIIEDVFEVVSSLGWQVSSIREKKERDFCINGKTYTSKKQYMVYFIPDEDLPLQISRKKERLTNKNRNFTKMRHFINKIEEVQSEESDFYCITVKAESHLFLITRSYVPTRNTISMLGLMRSDIEAGVPVFSIDMKGTPTFAAKLATWAKENNREFYHFVHGKPSQYRIPNSPGQAFYDPLGSGSPSAKADMLLNLRAWDDAASVYKEDMKQLLSVLFNALDQADPSKAPKIDWNHGGIYTVYSVLQGNNLDHLAAACEGKPVEEAIIALAEGYEEAQKKGRTNQGVPNAINNLRGQMNTIINSDYGRWMKVEPGGRNINLAQVAKKRNAVVLFSLDSDNAEEFSKYVGSMIMADLTRLSSSLRDEQEKKQIAIYADEFQTLNMGTVKGLLEKGRESGMAVTLAQQSLEQVVVASARNGEAMLNSIMDVCSNFLVHAGSTFDSAERLSKLIGKEEYVDYGTTSDSDNSSLFGKKSKRKPNVTLHGQKKERWKFSPEQFMSLSIPDESNNYYATAVLVNKKSADPYFSGVRGGLARELWMIPAQEVLTDYYAVGDHTPVKAHGSTSGESGNIALSKGDSVESHAPIPLEDAPIQRRPVKKATIAQGLEREKSLPSMGATVVDDGYEPTPDEYYEESYPENEDDGNFKWEDVEDTEAQEEEEIIPTMNFSSISNLGTAIKEEKHGSTAAAVAPTPSATPSPEALRSSMKESKFTQQMRAKAEAEKRAREEAARAKAEKLPVRPSTGSTAASEKKVEDDLDDIALPPLDEIF